jgi:hypothetical protein
MGEGGWNMSYTPLDLYDLLQRRKIPRDRERERERELRFFGHFFKVLGALLG